MVGRRSIVLERFPIASRPVTAQIYTHNSNYGWGAKYLDYKAAGSWDRIIGGDHINFKELLTLLYALICFRDSLCG